MSLSHTSYKPNEENQNFLLVKCTLCTKDMILTEGSVILGSKWYHEDCFAKTESKICCDVKYGDELKQC